MLLTFIQKHRITIFLIYLFHIFFCYCYFTRLQAARVLAAARVNVTEPESEWHDTDGAAETSHTVQEAVPSPRTGSGSCGGGVETVC